MTGTWAMLLGGRRDGELIRFNTGSCEVKMPLPALGANFDYPPVETYRAERVATPDLWMQAVWVHESISMIDLQAMPESVIIKAIMLPWRRLREEIAELDSRVPEFGSTPLLGPVCSIHGSHTHRCSEHMCGRPPWPTPSMSRGDSRG